MLEKSIQKIIEYTHYKKVCRPKLQNVQELINPKNVFK